MPNSIHEGHRERMRKEIIRNGFDEHTPPHKILEFLLFYCISRKDTNELAHTLINRFGSLPGVLDAPIDELAAVKGMGEHSALLLKSIVPIARIYLNQKTTETPSFSNLDQIGEYAVKQYMGVTAERAGIIALDGKGKLLGFEFLSDGDITSVGLSVRDATLCLIKRNAVAAVLVHNHPSGFAIPSKNDGIVTERFANSLKNSGIYLVDHIIIGSNDFVSMAQSKDYSHIFECAE
ncbi:MAG: RadC family protein [Clostridia bacterium]|nr:RadC family protein [Clostridia bacterium]